MPNASSPMPRILVTNDDGIDAPGIKLLKEIADGFSDDVWVIAPETQQSGMAHSVSLHKPLHFREVSEKHFAVSGTPTDCVITAIRAIVPEKIDLVLSGINRGPNVADDITHSGTVAGAMEAALFAIPAIAFSQSIDFDAENPFIHWETAKTFADGIIKKLLDVKWEADSFFNVNFPDCASGDVKGIKMVGQGKHKFYKELHCENNAEGKAEYWVNWADAGVDPRRPDVDIHWLAENYVTITPLSLDLTNYRMLNAYKAQMEL
jgi:5'-nucleotidase